MSNQAILLAFDLGTTTLAGRLIDRQGEVLAEARRLNPQAEFGADIITRLEKALKGNAIRLQELLVGGLNDLLDELLTATGYGRSAIVAAAAAGNSGISHLLRQLPVESILFPPHRPAHRQGLLLEPKVLGLELSSPLYLFPLVSGYVGGDLVAFLFSRNEQDGRVLYLDVGTNGEMALLANNRWLVTSVAGGPAFEGGGIACGMIAQRGAVTGVALNGDSLRLTVLGGGPPQGLCGSGLAEAVAAALEGGLIDRHGTIADPLQVSTNLSRHIVEGRQGRVLRLYRDAAVDLHLTQQDIRSFQLAKGAVRAGIECLLARSGLAAAAVDQVIMTGAFGFSLAPEVLKRVAILPENMVDKVLFVEAGVLAGCSRFLLDPVGEERVRALADSLRPYPLSGTPGFEQAFLHALDF
ncbi:MAG: ASKHA domain-containing protein [Syntrophotaleaceae bacterium]